MSVGIGIPIIPGVGPHSITDAGFTPLVAGGSGRLVMNGHQHGYPGEIITTIVAGLPFPPKLHSPSE